MSKLNLDVLRQKVRGESYDENELVKTMTGIAEMVIKRYYPPSDQFDMEDKLQSCLLKCWELLDSGKCRADLNIMSFLYTVSRNTLSNAYKGVNRRQEVKRGVRFSSTGVSNEYVSAQTSAERFREFTKMVLERAEGKASFVVSFRKLVDTFKCPSEIVNSKEGVKRLFYGILSEYLIERSERN